jgi:tight adherence protein C
MNSNLQFAFVLVASVAALIVIISGRFLIERKKQRARYQLIHSIERDSKINNLTPSSSDHKDLFSFTTQVLDSKYGEFLKKTGNKAGLWEKSEFENLINQKIQISIASFILTALLIQVWGLPIAFLFITPLFAFLAPDLRLFDRARSRIESITRALPDTIDLLNMCVAAGIGFHSGMQRVAASQDNPLSQEFSRVLAEMKLGQSRSAALSALSERLQIESLEQFVNSILQVDRLGVPMTRVLEEQSKRLRNQRREKAREQAQKLPVKILAPTMIFMLPSLLIIVLGPAVISILRSFG